MRELKDGIRSLVRIGYDGSVHKTFRGTDADKRFANEVRVLRYLEDQDCPYVPQVLEAHEDELRLVTTNCGQPVERLSDEKTRELFDDLERNFGVRHDDPFLRNITYSPVLNRFCIIDFELAKILAEDGDEDPVPTGAAGSSSPETTPAPAATGAGSSDESTPLPAGRIEAASETTLGIRWAGVSRKGGNKEENEDSLIVFSADNGGTLPLELDGTASLHEGGYILAVSDGLGGHAAGALASKLVVSKLAKNLSGSVGSLRGIAQPLEELIDAVEETHHAINRMAVGRPSMEGMAATLVCGWFWERHLHFVHIGDSRIYRWRKGELTQLTNDHTRVGRMYRDGKLNERQARSHPMSHVLQQVIGGQHQVISPQVGSLGTRVDDYYLLCSDGVTDGLWNKHLVEIFESADAGNVEPAAVAATILERATDAAGVDDTTLIVARIDGES